MRWGVAAVSIALAASTFAGCLGAQIEESQRQIQSQQAELEQLRQEVAALSAQRNYPTTAPPPGTCDPEVSRAATRRGGERFAAADFAKALGYYQDAMTACPDSAQAELNLARTYEALGQRDDAIAHYRNAEKGGGESGDAAARQARDALSRLSVR